MFVQLLQVTPTVGGEVNLHNWTTNRGVTIITHRSVRDSTIFLSDLTGKLVGTCTRMSPNMVQHHRQNSQCTQVVFSVYEANNIFNIKCGNIVHIKGSMDLNINRFHDILEC